MNTNEIISPGDYVASAKEFTAGHGVYSRYGDLRACLVGTIQAEEQTETNMKAAVSRPTIHVRTQRTVASEYVVRVEDIVLCKVTRVNYNQAYVDILVRQSGILIHKQTQHIHKKTAVSITIYI